MKKIISIVLCAVMLMSAMVLASYAEGYSIMELEDFGQQHWVIAGKTENAPIADGVIDEGEYTLVVEGMDPYNDDADDRFFCIDPQGLDVEEFNLYISYDDEYLYIGATIKESEMLDGEGISFHFSCNPADMHDGIAISYKFGGAPNTSEAEAFNATVDGDVVTYEIVIRRTMLVDYMGYEDVDDIKEFALMIVMGDDRDEVNAPDLWPEMWFGTIVPGFDGLASSKDAALEEGKIWGRGADGRRFPHVMILGDAPEVEETVPAETTPAETTPADTTPADTTPTETDPAVNEPVAEGGCGASVAAVAVALVAALGTCVAFINKRR